MYKSDQVKQSTKMKKDFTRIPQRQCHKVLSHLLGPVSIINEVKIQEKNNSHWTTICKSWSQGATTMFQSMLGRKHTPVSKTVGHPVYQNIELNTQGGHKVILVFESLLGWKCMPGLMIVGIRVKKRELALGLK